MKAGAFRRVELFDVGGGDELNLRTLGERARLIKDEAATSYAGAQCVRHSQSVARGGEPAASLRRPCEWFPLKK